MSPKKGDPVAPRPGRNEYDIRYGETVTVEGWREVGNKAPGNAYRAWEQMRTDPGPDIQTERHHQLRFDLAYRDFKVNGCRNGRSRSQAAGASGT